ncbi:hypothetical protein [Sapientia aquatica]|uniref:Uncharacterized protein n=1 Tax=Sapientia aquatica TaxID=1549640 RepID=A0A4R5VT97_9BURK|nr:hypothetical protein [Sapientia aquatica]TDK61198.1 hypothetical protein E2I14_17555 [Sapientia aquatica]
MARRRKEMRMPTVELRLRAWTRAIKKELFPDESFEEPMAHRINSALQKRAMEVLINDGDRKIVEQHFPSDGKEFVSSGRWTDWWSGKVQPELSKIELIEKIFPGTMRWLKPGFSRNKEHPAHTLFYAIDLWASTEPRQNESMQLLMAIANTWAPRAKGEGPNQQRRMGWYLVPFTSKELVPPDLVLNHYCSLEPASILESMLWTGNHFKIHTTQFFQIWLMDLIAAALATDALLLEIGHGQDAVELGGDSGLISAFLLLVFIRKTSFYSQANKESEVKFAIQILINWTKESLPNNPEFTELIWIAIDRFQGELLQLGIDSDSIKNLDATTDWWLKTP